MRFMSNSAQLNKWSFNRLDFFPMQQQFNISNIFDILYKGLSSGITEAFFLWKLTLLIQ